MSRVVCTLVMLAFSLMLIGQQTGHSVNFQRQSKCYVDVVWYGTTDGLYQAHHAANLQDCTLVQSKNGEISLSNIVDMYEEPSPSYNSVMLAIYDGQYYQTFGMDTGYVFAVSQPRPITRLAWEKLKKDSSK